MGVLLRSIFISEEHRVVGKKRILIDLNIYLAKFLAVYKTDAGLPFYTYYEEQQVLTSHYYGLIKLFTPLAQDHQLCFVLDWNPHLPLKKAKREERRKIKEQREIKIESYRAKLDIALKEEPYSTKVEGISQIIKTELKATVDLSLIDYPLLQKVLFRVGWPLIKVRTMEAEKYAAISVRKGLADYFITTDSDTLILGSDYVTEFNQKPNGIWNFKVKSLKRTLTENELTYPELVDAAVIVGTDYGIGVKGVGPKGFRKYFSNNKFPLELTSIRDYFLELGDYISEPVPLFLETDHLELTQWKNRFAISI